MHDAGYPIPSPVQLPRLVILDCKNPLESPPAAARILVIRLGALGDVVRTLPALHSLRAHYRDARITWLVEAGSVEVLIDHPEIDEVMLFPRQEIEAAWREGRAPALWRRLRAFVKALRAHDFDLVVDFHSILKSGVLSRLSGAPIRVGYARPFGRELGWLFSNRRARLAPDVMSRFDRNQGLVRFLAIEAVAGVAPLAIPDAAARRIREQRSNRAPAPDRVPDLVVIHPGSSGRASYKRYPSWDYAAVARALVEQDGLACWVVRGSTPEEELLAHRIVDGSDGRAQLAPTTPALSDLAALIAEARLFIGSDSGPLHLASILGTPAVQIMGPTHPVENEPWSETPWRRAHVPVFCSPCRRGCDEALCMNLIRHEDVLGAARELLEITHEHEPRRRRSDPTPESADHRDQNGRA